jgi:hypothetical protein
MLFSLQTLLQFIAKGDSEHIHLSSGGSRTYYQTEILEVYNCGHKTPTTCLNQYLPSYCL